jgi:hypothetical protein
MIGTQRPTTSPIPARMNASMPRPSGLARTMSSNISSIGRHIAVASTHTSRLLRPAST